MWALVRLPYIISTSITIKYTTISYWLHVYVTIIISTRWGCDKFVPFRIRYFKVHFLRWKCTNELTQKHIALFPWTHNLQTLYQPQCVPLNETSWDWLLYFELNSTFSIVILFCLLHRLKGKFCLKKMFSSPACILDLNENSTAGSTSLLFSAQIILRYWILLRFDIHLKCKCLNTFHTMPILNY